VLAALRADLRQRHIDHIVFSGDATALGFEEEMARAAELLGLGQPDALPGLAVPGNHDYCTRAAMHGGHFERHFAPWQRGERIDEAVYPFAQRVGPAWLVAVCSARANAWPTDASGAVGSEQLCRLETLLARLEGGPRILVTHYPVFDAGGTPERRGHGLRDLTDVLAVARRGGVSLWLHGHLHHDYHHLPTELAPFPILCAGSATQRKRWSYGECTLDGRRLHVLRRVYDADKECFVDRETFELELT
jgi:3',5'-cyclic AMP phosphodiesterase CpdA